MVVIAEHDDEDLIYFFRNFEKIQSKDKADVDWEAGTDFKVFREYLTKDIQEIQEKLKSADDAYLYYVCEHIFNILDWIKLIVEDAGFPTFGVSIEKALSENLGDGKILNSIYDASFKKWVAGKTGQYRIGENYYNILAGKIYYHDSSGNWSLVDSATVFDLKPNQTKINDMDLIEQLNSAYKETHYDTVIRKWKERGYTGNLSANFLKFPDKETTPEKYAEFSMSQVRSLLKNPVSVAELESWSGGEIAELEHMVKIALFVLRLVQKRRKENDQTIYLLRDCLMFYELHKTLDVLYGEDTLSDELLIGRKLLSHEPGHWGYYVVALEALYTAHVRYPEDFKEFYNEYVRLMDVAVSESPKLAEVLERLSVYINKHIQKKKKVVIFDIGFQGSIALLTKYIIDRYVSFSDSDQIETDIQVGVGSQWSKDLFGRRYDSDYFPMLNRTQLMTRSNDLYYYKEGSINSGQVQVEMGSEENQKKAAIELVVLVMVAMVTQDK